ncbi:MFS transporter [Sanguibacter hominis ATCC BAA-789]|uniref:MFS transporter n=1 Tax=Sanguibacter hominis ATCC BAA-789 TaxID=1312740 RepID=A0A9X5IRU9_9MICO|nr:MDR family MFS transporter [Sanguibacter hominis]NKX93980.1 MFS transporter [Sanguibacter hominis ATCC BAA-789]
MSKSPAPHAPQTGAAQSPDHLPGEPSTMSHTDILRSISGIFMGLFVSILSTSIVSSSLPRIVADLGGNQSAYTWVVTATLLTTTISTPIWGKVADLFDRKVIVQLSLVLTVVSAGLAGLAQSSGTLIAWRALQGVGAGGLTAVSMVLIADIVAPRQRGKYMGYMGGIMAVATIGGPLLGGFLTDAVSWRANFFIAVPFAVVAIVLLQKTLHLPPFTRPEKVDIDYWGALLMSAGISTLLLWVTFAGNSFDWASWQTTAMVGGSVVVLAIAVWVESRVAAPIIPLDLFRNRTVTLAIIASAAVGVVLFGTTVFLSQYMQIARGYSPTVSGLLTIPLILGQLTSSIATGQAISRRGRYKVFLVVGGVLMPVGLGLMGTIDYQTNLGLICLYMAIIGVGMGMLMQNMMLAAQNTLSPAELSTGSATIAFFRSLGGALGVSVLGAILGSRITSDITSGLKSLGVDGGPLSGGTLPNVHELPAPIAKIVESAYGAGVAEVFLVAAPIALVTLVAILFIKEVPLGTKSNLELRMEELAREDAEQS